MLRSALLAVGWCGTGFISIAHGGTIREVIISGAGGGVGTEQMADADGLDRRINFTPPDNNKSFFELWWLNGSHFGLRFVGQGFERWVGVCPFNSGINHAALKKEELDQGFIWISSFYRSMDDGFGLNPSGINRDDDMDRRRDSVAFTFDVLKDVLVGQHLEDITIVQTTSWNTVDNDAFPDIPGDIENTDDGPTQLLNHLVSGGALDPQGGDGDDEEILLSQLQTFVPEPSVVLMLVPGLTLFPMRRYLRGGRPSTADV